MFRLTIAIAILPLLSASIFAQSYSYSHSWGTGLDKVNTLEKQIDRRLGFDNSRSSTSFWGGCTPPFRSTWPATQYRRQDNSWGKLNLGFPPSTRLPLVSKTYWNSDSSASFSTTNSSPGVVLWQVVRNWDSDLLIDDASSRLIAKGKPISLNVTGQGNLAETVIPMILNNCKLELVDTDLGYAICQRGQSAAIKKDVQEGVYEGRSLKKLLVLHQLNGASVMSGPMPLSTYLQLLGGQTGLEIDCDFRGLGITGWEYIDTWSSTRATNSEVLGKCLDRLGLRYTVEGTKVLVCAK